MCGIAGFLRRGGPGDAASSLAQVKAMCDRIRHRGPDDEGFHVDRNCALGMRRLSIIDLNTGHQPISNEDGSVWVVFNGEIYDYRALREELIAKGHRFRTASDTETLVHLYEEEGIDGIHKLRGMFAYAIWDARRGRLFLARDRFGKKPLYYAALPEGFYFGSEIKCLLAAGVPREVDAEALRLYFHFGWIPDPYSGFKAIRKLEPGCWLTCDSAGEVKQGRYWKLPPPVEVTPQFTEDEACERLRDLFDESVRIRMVADVPLGAFLSGGIDSSLTVASMALQSREPVKTFSIGFEDAKFNELPYASLVAKKYATDHHEIIVRPDSVSLVEKLVQHFDEPFGDSSAIPTYIVSEFARRHVTVALSGDGGDELFAGYESFQRVLQFESWDRVPRFARGAIAALAEALPYSARGKNYLHMVSRASAMDRYFEFNYAPYFMEKRLLDPRWLPPAEGAFLSRSLAGCLLADGASPLSQALYFEETSKLAGDMLTKVDRMSMAASLEVRCPFLDHSLAEFAQRIPNSWKLRNGRGKDILLRALGDRLPPELLNRPKMGFAVPMASWLKGPLRQMLHDCLLGSSLASRGIVSPRFVAYLLAEHESGRRDNQTWLWMLLMLELWFRQIEQPEPGPSLASPALSASGDLRVS